MLTGHFVQESVTSVLFSPFSLGSQLQPHIPALPIPCPDPEGGQTLSAAPPPKDKDLGLRGGSLGRWRRGVRSPVFPNMVAGVGLSPGRADLMGPKWPLAVPVCPRPREKGRKERETLQQIAEVTREGFRLKKILIEEWKKAREEKQVRARG